MLDFFITSAYAQDAAGNTAQANPIAAFAPFIIIFVIFYFLMLRPQQKKAKQEQAMIVALKKGDNVYTKSGMLGTITGTTDEVITIEVAEGIKVKFYRSQVGGLQKKIEQK